MKTNILNSFRTVCAVIGCMVFVSSCTDNLLDQQPTTVLGSDAFWKTENDATYALNGLYAAIRPCFDRDYYFDGHGEYQRVRGTAPAAGNFRLGEAYNAGDAYWRPSGYGNGFDKMYRYLYGGINRCNYVIENVEKMLESASPTSRTNLETIIGEAQLLRGMCYFRLISMWGDVPLIDHVVFDNSEVASLPRTPIGEIKTYIEQDFTDAFNKLPAKASALGRAAKPAALAFRGKLNLYWASWNNFGWPELDGFTPSASAAQAAYKAAADDFKSVIDDYGLNLYRGGEPGDIDALGKAEILPNYYYLFTPIANGDPEMIMVFTHGGTGTGQGEELMRDFAGRNHEYSQVWVCPRFEVADRYQLVSTGDFTEKLIAMNPNTTVDGVPAREVKNSAVNPKSYEGRDYRMKSSIMWDYEMSLGFASLVSTGWCPFIYKTWNMEVTIDGQNYISYNTDGTNTGYVYRKFLRNTPGLGRAEGNMAYPVMRLADVYLMYAEADNELNGPQPKAIELVNKIRHRGNLPPLAGSKTADKSTFFSAIEQERIIELLAEGMRGFDLRRWRAIERVWCPPFDNNGVWRIDTHGDQMERYYQNASQLVYQQAYIFKIPQSERDLNPNLTQNKPWM